MSDGNAKSNEIKRILAVEAISLVAKFTEYDDLLGEGNTNIDILNKSASKFFSIFQQVVWTDLVMHLMRITGPKASDRKGERKNITIRQLPELTIEIFRDEVQEKVNIAVEKSKFVEDARNKVLAHLDLNVALSPNAGGIKRGNRDEMRDAVKAVAQAIESALPGQVSWRTSHYPGGANDLLKILDSALKK